MRIYLNDQSTEPLAPADVRALIAEAIACPVDDDAVLKDQADGRVVAVGVDGDRRVVKLYAVDPIKSIMYHVVRRSRAWREWSGAASLAAIGIRVVRPIALVNRPGGQWSQALVMPFIEGATLCHWLADGDGTEADRRRVFEAIGRQIGVMTAAGLVNRDHKSANLMIDPGALDAEPTVLDPAGIRRRTSARVRRLFALLHETVTRHPRVGDAEFPAVIEAARLVDPTLPVDPVLGR